MRLIVQRRHLLAVASVGALALAACSSTSGPEGVATGSTSVSSAGDTSTTSSEPSTTTAPARPAIPWDTTVEWESFGPDTEIETGTIEVPLDYTDHDAGTIELFIARHLADESKRIGSLLVNPGGPGFGGSDFAIFAEQIFSPAILRHFDIVGWDPRGTGRSEPAIDCIDDYDAYFTGTDMTPDDDAERQQLVDLADDFTTQCEEKNAELLPFVGTNNSARDIDSIRRALGEATISYFGFSYGSELGATWATLFPDTVRAAVLDGASDPGASFLESGLQQAAGFEASITTFLAQCSADPTCAFHSDGDAEGAFDDLMLRLDEEPVPSAGDRPPVTRSMAITAVAMAMYDSALWPKLERALDNARYGDGAFLLELFDDYYQRRDDGTYDNSLEAFQAIVCMDRAERPTVATEDEWAERYREVAPRFAAGTTGSYFCTFFAPSPDPRVTIDVTAQVPIIVIGTTGDPATPLDSTRRMADAIADGRLVVVVADKHTGYGENECIIDVVDLYLIDPTDAPDDELVCDE